MQHCPQPSSSIVAVGALPGRFRQQQQHTSPLSRSIKRRDVWERESVCEREIARDGLGHMHKTQSQETAEAWSTVQLYKVDRVLTKDVFAFKQPTLRPHTL